MPKPVENQTGRWVPTLLMIPTKSFTEYLVMKRTRLSSRIRALLTAESSSRLFQVLLYTTRLLWKLHVLASDQHQLLASANSAVNCYIDASYNTCVVRGSVTLSIVALCAGNPAYATSRTVRTTCTRGGRLTKSELEHRFCRQGALPNIHNNKRQSWNQ